MMGNEQDAADMAQEALLRAWRSLSSYKGQSRFFYLALPHYDQRLLDELRKRKNNQNMSIQEMEESGMETADPPKRRNRRWSAASCGKSFKAPSKAQRGTASRPRAARCAGFAL